MLPNHYCIQCIDKLSGNVGTFAYHTDNPFETISPVFNDLVPLWKWLKSKGLKTGNGLGNFDVIEIEK